MKRRSGFTLIEAIVTLCVLGVLLPGGLQAFGNIFLFGLRINDTADKAFCAEWWFNRLEPPVSRQTLAAMPQRDAAGKMRFRWEAEEGNDGTFHIILYVTNASNNDVPFVIHRVY